MRTDIQPFTLAVLILIFMLFPAMLLFTAPSLNAVTSADSIGNMLMDKSGLTISIDTVSPGIRTLAADPENGLVLKVQVNDDSGAGVPGAGVRLKADILEAALEAAKTGDGFCGSESIGTFTPSEGFTDARGSFLTVYTPAPAASIDTAAGSSESGDREVYSKSGNNIYNNSFNTLVLTSHLTGSDESSFLRIKLVPVPVVLIHGYQASPDIFSGLSQYLKLEGYSPLPFKYTSENGVSASAGELSSYLQKKTAELRASGIQTNRFDLIGHSMGGLVARYYTVSSEYPSIGNVRKLIFISVPQKGSPFASLGIEYYKDNGMSDLVPDSSLYSSILPSMINGGLNPSIQTGSILGSHDEVVGTESAGLSDWGIDTEQFEVGESNFTIDKLLSGEILQAANHKMVLYNKKVYERVQQMLESDISYPLKR